MLYRHQAPGKGARLGRCSGTAMTARATDCTTVRLYDCTTVRRGGGPDVPPANMFYSFRKEHRRFL